MREVTKSESGGMILNVVIGLFIFSANLIALASIFEMQGSVTKTTDQKQEVLDLNQLMLMALTKPDVCRCVLNQASNPNNGFPLSFDSTSLNPQIELSTLYSTCDAGQAAEPIAVEGKSLSAMPNGVFVKQILLRNIVPTSNPPNNEYVGLLEVDFNQENLQTPRKPASIGIRFQTNSSDPANAKTIASCSSQSSSSGILASGSQSQANAATVSTQFTIPANGQLMLTGETRHALKRRMVLKLDGNDIAISMGNDSFSQNGITASFQVPVLAGIHTIEAFSTTSAGAPIAMDYIAVTYIVLQGQ